MQSLELLYRDAPLTSGERSTNVHNNASQSTIQQARSERILQTGELWRMRSDYLDFAAADRFVSTHEEKSAWNPFQEPSASHKEIQVIFLKNAKIQIPLSMNW